ncbi:hypothetical protein OBBRIDRAFT_797697 [Obba rivulosa]|uniref:Uncharacterized protein n=1 Tax=Obba rivulosa TaxID=1052685 RepID=A0A8E2AJT2_9APHY|nr:hypothetical protein OBBRIDRAFT_797697 [Obba rivulosa]
MSRYSPTSQEVRTVADRAICIFASLNLECCLVGGLACSLFGISRTPGDVDLVIVTALHSQESLKRMLCDRDSNFFLVPSKKAFATYKVLWYGYPYRRCKVDILLPGIMNIPSVPKDRVEQRSGFPVMPLLPLLMLKLQAWEDHRNHYESYMREKQHTDVSDIRSLLKIARRNGISCGNASNSWIPSSLVEETKRRVKSWVERMGSAENHDWAAIGFDPPRQRRTKASKASASDCDRLAERLRSMYIR